MAFVANNDTNDPLVVSSPDGVNWSPSTMVNQSSKAAPALASVGLQLFLRMAFVANNDSNDLLVVSSPDGVNFTSNTKVNQSSKAAPAVLNIPPPTD